MHVYAVTLRGWIILILLIIISVSIIIINVNINVCINYFFLLVQDPYIISAVVFLTNRGSC